MRLLFLFLVHLAHGVLLHLVHHLLLHEILVHLALVHGHSHHVLLLHLKGRKHLSLGLRLLGIGSFLLALSSSSHGLLRSLLHEHGSHLLLLLLSLLLLQLEHPSLGDLLLLRSHTCEHLLVLDELGLLLCFELSLLHLDLHGHVLLLLSLST